MLFSGKIAITSYTRQLIQNAKVGDTLENSGYLDEFECMDIYSLNNIFLDTL